jgi:hypothetical protein
MENRDDDEIQRLIEAQLNMHGARNVPEQNEDAELYRLLFRELENSPATKEGSQLADRVVMQIRLKKERWEQISYSASILAVFLSISGLVYAALVSTNAALPGEIAQFFLTNKSVCLFIVFAFCAIQFLDRLRLKYH